MSKQGSTHTHQLPIFYDNVLIKKITSKDILEAINKLPPKRSLGPDGIPPFIYKNCGELLVVPLLHIFNLIIAGSTFPRVWKESKIIPIPKSKDSNNKIELHRPITIVCTASKVFETILCDKIYNQIKHQICVQQHGFIPGRSVVTNLCHFLHALTENIDVSSQTDVVYTDFQKAFDKVDHEILIFKMYSYGFSTELVQLLKSYLSERTLILHFQNYTSRPFIATSGVPQGSHLGPLLFNLFINDLPEIIKNSNVLLYADDLKIFKRIQNHSDTTTLQSDLDSLATWCDRNNLPLNLKKCSQITFTKKFQPVKSQYFIGDSPLQINMEIRASFTVLIWRLKSRIIFVKPPKSVT